MRMIGEGDRGKSCWVYRPVPLSFVKFSQDVGGDEGGFRGLVRVENGVLKVLLFEEFKL